MAKDINSVVLSGRLTKDIETREAGAAHVCNGSIAVNRSVKKDGKWEEVASFVNIRMWASSPKQLEYYQSAFKKGVAISAQGQLITESYEKEGKKNTYTYVLCDVIQPHSSGRSEGGSSNSGSFNASEGFPEDVPF